jgi:hypothetical protein
MKDSKGENRTKFLRKGGLNANARKPNEPKPAEAHVPASRNFSSCRLKAVLVLLQ